MRSESFVRVHRAAGRVARLKLMRRAIWLLVWMSCAGLARVAATQTVADRIRAHLGPADPLAAFYAARAYRPAWVSDSGPDPAGLELTAVLARALADGLDSADYDAGTIAAELSGARDAETLARVELHLSRALARYASDLALGRVVPARVDSLWTGGESRNGITGVAALDAATQAGGGSVSEVLHGLRPPQDGYALLRLALQWYRGIAARGGWGTVGDGADLLRGGQGDRVRRLRDRLAATGDLPDGRGPAAA